MCYLWKKYHAHLGTVICQDIRKLDCDRLKKISDIDGVFGHLYSYGIKALKLFKLQWFLAENVGGLRNSNDGKADK